MELLVSQRAQIFELLKNFGVEPATINFTSGRGNFDVKAAVLRVKGTEYFFTFEAFQGDRYCAFSPGEQSMRSVIKADMGWDEQLHFLAIWCNCLRRELTSTDPWADLERQAVSFEIDSNDKKTSQPFSVGEFNTVKKTLAVVQALLSAYAQDNEQQQKSIAAGISALLESAKTQDRKSWFYTVIGFVASTSVAMALAPDQTKAIYEALKKGLEGAILFIGN